MLVGSGEAVRSLPQASLLTLERTTHLCGTCPLVMLEGKGVLERVPPPHPHTVPRQLPRASEERDHLEGGVVMMEKVEDAASAAQATPPSPALRQKTHTSTTAAAAAQQARSKRAPKVLESALFAQCWKG